MENRTIAGYPQSPAAGRAQSKKKHNAALILLICLVAVLALGFLLAAGGAAGFYFYTDHNYKLAVASIDKGDYSSAQASLAKVASFYKDAPDLMVYAQAGAAMKGGDYFVAMKYYRGLLDFRDSDTLSKEAEYQLGSALYDKKDYEGAMAQFLPISDYKNSSDYVFLSRLFLKEFDSADRDGMTAAFKRLRGLSGMNEAMELMQTDAFLYYLLEGEWSDGSTNEHTFSLTYKGNWNCNYSFPYAGGPYFILKDGKYQVGSYDIGWTDAFRFTFKTPDEVEIYCFKDSSTYTLHRK